MPKRRNVNGLKVERVLIGSISQDPSNARSHSERNIDAIVGSLRRFGQQKPIVVDSKGVIRAGNGTYEAAKKLKWKEIDVVRSDLKGSEATAYAIADNRTAELAVWDNEVLAELLSEMGPELQRGMGFSDEELQEVFGAPESRGPELRSLSVKPIPKMVWVLVGIPLHQYSEIAKYIEKISVREDTLVEMVVEGEDDEDTDGQL